MNMTLEDGIGISSLFIGAGAELDLHHRSVTNECG